MQFPASPIWSFCIKHYLFLKCKNTGPLRLFSDGNTGMVFILNGQLKIRNKQTGEIENLPEVFVYGQVDHYHDIFSSDNTSLLIVVFQPYGHFSLFGIPAYELKANIFDAGLIFGRGLDSLSDALRSEPSFQKSIQLIENHFTAIRKENKSAFRIVQPVVKTIIQARGQLVVSDLTRLTGYPERKLERLFQQEVGLSPLKYLQIARLHHCLSIMRSANKTLSFTNAGLESGYYDQSHLIRNFKQITGLTPTQYLSTPGTLAVNLVLAN